MSSEYESLVLEEQPLYTFVGRTTTERLMVTPARTIDSLRVAEYTGANRCIPCTIVNAIIATATAAAIAVLWLPAGFIALLAFAVVIYLRGYLVPGTPTLTARYLPERVLDRFDKSKEHADLKTAEDDSTALRTNGGSEPFDTEVRLRTAEIVEEEQHGDDLRLTRNFREAWWRRIRELRDGDEASERLAAVLEVSPEHLTTESGERFVVSFDGDPIGQWPSDAAFYADLAVEPCLRERITAWGELGDRNRTELIAGLRAFLEACPTCEADLDTVESARRSCCSSDVVRVNVDCTVCGARVFNGSYR